MYDGQVLLCRAAVILLNQKPVGVQAEALEGDATAPVRSLAGPALP